MSKRILSTLLIVLITHSSLNVVATTQPKATAFTIKNKTKHPLEVTVGNRDDFSHTADTVNPEQERDFSRDDLAREDFPAAAVTHVVIIYPPNGCVLSLRLRDIKGNIVCLKENDFSDNE